MKDQIQVLISESLNLAQLESGIVVFLLHQVTNPEEILFVLGTCLNLVK